MQKENLLHKEDDRRTAFSKYFPAGILIPLNPQDLKGVLKGNFREKRSIPFEHFAIYHKDESVTLVQVRTETAGWFSAEFIDKNQKRETVGGGKFIASVDFKRQLRPLPQIGDYPQPTIVGTNTSVSERRKGLGLRRLLVMNAISRMYFDQPLHSHFVITDEEIKVWEKLVNMGKARKVVSGYVFA